MNDTELAVQLAAETGQRLLRLRHDSGLFEQALGDAADALANDYLLGELARMRPVDAVLSEELPDDSSRLARERLWIIDPLDGTREYREGRADWGVHVALAVNGVITAAAVALAEQGLVYATRRPSQTAELRATSVMRRIVVSRSRPPRFAEALAQALDAEIFSMGSAGAKAMAVVSGEAFAYVHEGGLNEWDAAAPAGVALAHGLVVCNLQGLPIWFNQSEVVLRNGFVVCRAEWKTDLLQMISNLTH